MGLAPPVGGVFRSAGQSALHAGLQARPVPSLTAPAQIPGKGRGSQLWERGCYLVQVAVQVLSFGGPPH